ncbi:hypothetical protein D9M68_625730 [compost metagenome]
MADRGEEHGFGFAGLVGRQLGLSQRALDFLLAGDVADAAEHDVFGLVGHGGERQADAAPVRQRIFAAARCGSGVPDIVAPAAMFVEQMAGGFVGHDHFAVGAADQAETHRRDLDDLVVERDAVRQGQVLLQSRLDELSLDVPDRQQHHGHQEQADGAGRPERGRAMAQDVAQRHVVGELPAGFAHRFDQDQVFGKPDAALESERILLQARRHGSDHRWQRAAVQRQPAVAVVERVAAAVARAFGRDDRGDAVDLQADPAALLARGVERGIEEEAVHVVHGRPQPDDGRAAVGAGAGVAQGEGFRQPAFGAGRDGRRRTPGFQGQALRDGFFRRGIDDAGIGRDHVGAVARRQD